MAGNNEPKKIFLEILDQLKAQIISGELKAGDKLPSERMLAEKLCVGRPSVREAIRALETLGLLRCVQGDGNYLADDLKNSLVEPMVFMFALSGGNLITAPHRCRYRRAAQPCSSDRKHRGRAAQSRA